jgi:predicted acyl esterase
MTMVGEPALHLSATVVGTDAEVNSRLWDVAPDGSVTLVSRGIYRWTGAPGAVSITYAMLGNGWTFAAGHGLRLEVTQNDAPYLRIDNYASAIQYSSVRLVLPVIPQPPAC